MNHITATQPLTPSSPSSRPPISKYLNSSLPKQQLFMHHFQTINKNHLTSNQKSHRITLQSNEEKYNNLMEDYNRSQSFIDSVVVADGDLIEINGLKGESLVEGNVLASFKESLKEEVERIRVFFKGRKYQNYRNLQNKEFMAVQTYSEVLASFGRNIEFSQLQSRILLPTQPKPHKQPQETTPRPTSTLKQQKQIQVDTSQLTQNLYNSHKGKKLDIILMQLIQQKKRKILVNDYFITMQLKLMQLLDYILQDQLEYVGLDAGAKTKLVLKNLQHFKGKVIEGQSKINLLKIFFQEFTTLKKQKEQLQLKTPVKRIVGPQGGSSRQKQFSSSNTVVNKNKTLGNVSGGGSMTNKGKESTVKVKKQQKRDFIYINNQDRVNKDRERDRDRRGNKFLQQPQWIQNLQ